MTPATSFLAGLIAVGTIAALAIAERSGITITGPARAIDGDTIILGGSMHVRLAEIDAPEHDQTCLLPSDVQIAPYACGEAATAALRYMLARDSTVTCFPRSTDRYGRVVAMCQNSEGDLAGRMVALGWAIVYPRYSRGTYDDRQSAAKAERIGVWSGSFDWPWDWRRNNK